MHDLDLNPERWPLLLASERSPAGLTTVTVMLIVLVPAAIVVTLAVVEASSVITKLDDKELTKKVTAFRESLGLQMPLGPTCQCAVIAPLRAL